MAYVSMLILIEKTSMGLNNSESNLNPFDFMMTNVGLT